MRDAVRVRIQRVEYEALLALGPAATQDPVLGLLLERMREGFSVSEDEAVARIELARDEYAVGSDNDIEVDDDAPFSMTDEGLWVGGWLWLPFPPDAEDEERLRAREPTYACADCARVWRETELLPVKDLLQRVAPGEPMPAGECPECGAVCHAAG